MFLEVETEESVEDSLQAYAAGLLEGYLTRWTHLKYNFMLIFVISVFQFEKQDHALLTSWNHLDIACDQKIERALMLQ